MGKTPSLSHTVVIFLRKKHGASAVVCRVVERCSLFIFLSFNISVDNLLLVVKGRGVSMRLSVGIRQGFAAGQKINYF